jgi:hypothetical protein
MVTIEIRRRPALDLGPSAKALSAAMPVMVRRLLTRVDAQLRNKDMGLELTGNAKQLLAKRGWDPSSAPDH